MCSPESVLLARSAAVEAAKRASFEPSVARRILVGKMLTGITSLVCVLSLSAMMPRAELERSCRGHIHRSAWKGNSANFALTEF
jgi:hypothetical protein